MSITLLSTDFDGTLVGFNTHSACPRSFARMIEAHVGGGGIWAINTGRSLIHLDEGLYRFDPPVQPQYAITLEREIFHKGDGGVWEPLGDWNRICEERHDRLFTECTEMWEFVARLTRGRHDVSVIPGEKYPEGFVTRSEALMSELCAQLDAMGRHHPEFGYQRNTVYLRFCHRAYNKGTALAALAKDRSVPRAEVMAAGDHFNDLSMLDASAAAMCACPANAIREVKDRVRLSDGYVAGKNFAEGVAEAFEWFERSATESVK